MEQVEPQTSVPIVLGVTEALGPLARPYVVSQQVDGLLDGLTAAAAYDRFVAVDEWWVESHTWYGSRENLRIDARAGGCFCEISGDNQVLHMLVTYVQPGVELKMTGGLGPLQMMGLHGGMSWRFVE